MLRKIKEKRRYFLIAVIVLATVGLSGYGLRKFQSETTEKNDRIYYSEQLKAVSHNIEDIQKIIDDPHAIIDPEILPLYKKQLDSIIDRCHAVIKRNTSPSVLNGSELSVASAELCRNLLSMAAYQKNLYDQFEVIIRMDPDEITLLSIRDTERIIRQTRHNITLIESSRYEDSYKKEIEDKLADLQKDVSDLQTESPNQDLNSFSASMEELQNELLLYRGNYWKNIVLIDGLKADIDKAL